MPAWAFVLTLYREFSINFLRKPEPNGVAPQGFKLADPALDRRIIAPE